MGARPTSFRRSGRNSVKLAGTGGQTISSVGEGSRRAGSAISGERATAGITIGVTCVANKPIGVLLGLTRISTLVGGDQILPTGTGCTLIVATS